MNIVIFYLSSIDPQKGGVERASVNLKDILIKQGYSVYFVCWKKTSKKDGIVYLPNDKILRCNANTNFFRDFILKENINVIIDASAVLANFSPFCNSIKDNKVKLIAVFHNSLFGMYGRTVPFPPAVRYKPIVRDVLKLKYVYYILIFLFKLKYNSHYKAIGEDYDCIVLLSAKFKSEVSFFCGSKSLPKVVVVPNVLPFEYDATSYTKSNTILFCGRMNSQKRPEYMLEIWKRLHRIYTDWSLIMLGGGEEMELIKKKSEEMGLERVSFPGYCNPVDYYKDAAIFCLTSAYEGFGLVLLEAMNYGCVPIAFNSYASASEIISHNIDGLLVNSFDFDEYARAISMLIDNRDVYKRLQANRLKKISLYSEEKISNAWNKLLNAI